MNTLIARISQTLQQRRRLLREGRQHTDVFRNSTEVLRALEKHLPSGGGLDKGGTIAEELFLLETRCIVFYTSFHHMNEGGFYDGWTQHKVKVRPDFDGIRVDVTGRNRNGILDHIAETYRHTLLDPTLI